MRLTGVQMGTLAGMVAALAGDCPVCPAIDRHSPIGKGSRIVGPANSSDRRVPRNTPCPCGSGRKAKKCCHKP